MKITHYSDSKSPCKYSISLLRGAIDVRFRNYSVFLCLSLVAIFGQLCQGATGDVLEKQTLPSGRTIEKIEWNGTEVGYILITYPKDFTKSKVHHLNFWFPGTGGIPGVGIANENEGYIEICLSYLAKKDFAIGEFAREHWTLCQSIEDSLVARKNFPVGQRIVSGVSKGGWLAFEMSIENPKGLDGVVIVAAGALAHEKRLPNFEKSQLSVLVCTGETDPNYPFAQLAEAYYQKCNLKDFSYEEWLTVGHSPKISTRVNEWLNVQTKKKESKEIFKSYCDSLITERMKELDKIKSPKEQYILLRHLLKSPATVHISASLNEQMLTKGRELGKQEAVTSWVKDYNILRKIVQSEVKLHKENTISSQKFAEINGHFVKLAQSTQWHDLKIRAAYGYLRNSKAIAISLIREQETKKQDYKDLVKEVEELGKQLDKQKPHDPFLLQQFQQKAADLGNRNREITMDAFVKVEWRNQFTLDDPQMKILMEEGKKALDEVAAYTGVSY